jgi:hypothetical protein
MDTAVVVVKLVDLRFRHLDLSQEDVVCKRRFQPNIYSIRILIPEYGEGQGTSWILEPTIS